MREQKDRIQMNNQQNKDSKALRKATIARWWEKLRSDPKRYAERLEYQRKRRESESIRQKERTDERARWAALPTDHPRKRRKRQAKPETEKARRKRSMQSLPDCVVANNFLHMKVADCPKELIEIKRQHIRLNRTLGTRI